ncbi:LrgB family protein [Porticoccus sp.]|uniref:LrgB family protein n=1 Tax=Porticoccus sp. TaxID=2024853 RepID=UPI003F69667D
MTAWLATTLLLVLTFAAFAAALWLYRLNRGRPTLQALMHPLVTGPLMVSGILVASHIDYDQYREANQLFFFLLGTTTVALAIPLHQQFHYIRRLLKPLIMTLSFGASFAVLSALIIAWLLGGTMETLISLAPKSVTTPIALGLSEKIGGIPALTAGVVVFTGVVGAVMGPMLFRWLGITDDRIIGFVTGICAHGVGTTRAFEISARCGAFASLGLGMTGALTAFTLPWLILFFLN